MKAFAKIWIQVSNLYPFLTIYGDLILPFATFGSLGGGIAECNIRLHPSVAEGHLMPLALLGSVMSAQ